jgi:hypothetical protein
MQTEEMRRRLASSMNGVLHPCAGASIWVVLCMLVVMLRPRRI